MSGVERPWKAEVDGYNARTFTNSTDAIGYILGVRAKPGQTWRPGATLYRRGQKHCWSCRCPSTWDVWETWTRDKKETAS